MSEKVHLDHGVLRWAFFFGPFLFLPLRSTWAGGTACAIVCPGAVSVEAR